MNVYIKKEIDGYEVRNSIDDDVLFKGSKFRCKEWLDRYELECEYSDAYDAMDFFCGEINE